MKFILLILCLYWHVANSEEVRQTPPLTEEKKEQPEHGEFKPLIFSLSVLYTTTTSTPVWSGNFSWNPTFYLPSNWALRGDFGIQGMKYIYMDQPGGTETSSETFPVIPMGLYLNRFWDWLVVEVGGGAQWYLEPNSNSLYPYVMGGIGYFFSNRSFKMERIFFEYNYIWADDGAHNEYRLGIAFRF